MRYLKKFQARKKHKYFFQIFLLTHQTFSDVFSGGSKWIIGKKWVEPFINSSHLVHFRKLHKKTFIKPFKAPQRSGKTKLFKLIFFLHLGSDREGPTVSKEQKIKLAPNLFVSLWNALKHVNPFLPNVIFLY